MTLDDEVAALRAEVQHLRDRQDVLDCIARHARGCDRHDSELLTSCYHPDGVDEHGAAVNPGPRYASYINAVHAATSAAHLHHVTTHTCEVDGDVAHAESYVIVALLAPDEATATLVHGRYVDRLERRDSTWRISARRAFVDLAMSGSAALLQQAPFREQAYPRGRRDRTDSSYDRPLDLGEGATSTW